MLLVTNIRVQWWGSQARDVSWEIGDTFEDVSDYRFYVLRSEAPEGPYTRISPDLEDTYTFRDIGVVPSGRNREWYYRVAVTAVSGGDTIVYGSADPRKVEGEGVPPGGVAVEAPPDRIVLEARYRHRMLMREFVGRRTLWLPRRRWGRRCSCIDVDLGKPKIDRCKACWQTRFMGGYHTPVELPVRVGVKPEQVVLHWLGKLTPGQTYAEAVADYRLKVGDLVIEVEGTRWRVDAVESREKLRARTRQVFKLTELIRESVEYEISLESWARDSLTASPKRALLPATDLESYENALNSRGLDA